MHELAITQSVVDTVTERITGGRVTRVRLQIGRLSGVLPSAVSFCFGLAVLAGRELRITSVEVAERV